MVYIEPHLVRDIMTFPLSLDNLFLSGYSSYFSPQLNGELKKGGTVSKRKTRLRNEAKGMPENFDVLSI
jgi:hypothetical protein